jgi:hypothetical protein
MPWQPGHKRPHVKYDGKLSKDRYAWLEVNFGKMVLSVDEDADDATEGYPTCFLVYQVARSRNLIHNMTALTEEELEAWKTFVDMVYEKALPVVRERDRLAAEAMEQGDDSYARSFRRDPILIVRNPESSRRSDVLEPLKKPTVEPQD